MHFLSAAQGGRGGRRRGAAYNAPMKLLPVLACLALLSTASALHAEPLPAPAPIPAPVENFDTGEPQVDHLVHEDEGSRIEELRVRGETRRIAVKTKGKLKGEYEILPDNAAKGVPQAPNGSRGVAGQRVWQVMAF